MTQSPYGGLQEGRRGITKATRHRLLVREVPMPLELPAEGPLSRRLRLKTTLSSWYYGDRVDLLTTQEQKSAIAERTAPPEPLGEGQE